MDLREAKRILGQPSYEDEHVLLYHGDCCSLMDRLPPEVFHLVVTSPPYNIGKDYETKLSLEDYLKWTRGWIEKVYRLTRPTGAFWLNLGYLSIEGKAKAIPIPYLVWDVVPFFLMRICRLPSPA